MLASAAEDFNERQDNSPNTTPSTNGYLHHLTLENFKSYAGLQTIGPFDRFTAVIGPNGSGKSNLMDALCFVLGINAGHLRSANLAELVHRGGTAANNNNNSRRKRAGEEGRKAIVTAHFIPDALKPDEIVALSRSVVSPSGVTEFRINNQPHSASDYHAFLCKYNIMTKARNFLVFQGDVESVAVKTPAELMRLVEQVSGSDQLAQEYNEAKAREAATSETLHAALAQRKTNRAELDVVKKQREDVAKYTAAQDKLSDLTLKHLLWRCWHAESQASAAREELNEKQQAVDQALTDLHQCEQEIAVVKKKHAVAQRDMLLVEKELAKAQASAAQQVSYAQNSAVLKLVF